ncbi:hypothetical protein BCR39DRAFT_535841 [Naematelia encephala]|uniref:Uncharacterized protein n=1 Tax=Naematelia encephala TaxID=71784 RepID=A0A1Y2B256_9TREE|nr:hypothetical protein BCR39DRAFT_535841 [Naematelia encephala]
MLPEPGAAHFVPSLLAHISETSGWKPDAALFSTILLALVVRNGGIIIDVLPAKGQGQQKAKSMLGKGDGSHGEIERVARCVKATYQTLFGLETTYTHLEPTSQPSDVVNAFLPPTSSPKSPLNRDDGDILRTSRTPSAASSSRYISALSTPSSETYFTHLRPRSSNIFPSPLLPAGAIVESPDQVEYEKPTDEVLVVSGLEKCESPVWIKLVDVLLKRRVETRDGREKELGDGFTLVWIREAGSESPSWLIDQFAAHTHVYASDIHHPPSYPSSLGLIPSEYMANLHSLLPYVHIHPPLAVHISNVLSALSNHPRLHTTLTGRAVRLFPYFVRAHRLLSSAFSLPPSWETALAIQQSLVDGQLPPKGFEDGKYGVGGGKGGVDTWARSAGEEPSLSDLAADVGESETWQGDGGLYAMPGNVEGVWETALRHRVRWRPERAEVMWRLKGGAEQGGDGDKVVSAKRKRRQVEEVVWAIASL